MYDQGGYNADTYSSSYQGSTIAATAPLPVSTRKSVKSRLGVRAQCNEENAFVSDAWCDVRAAGLQSRDGRMSPLQTNHGLVNSPLPGTPLRDEEPWIVLDETTPIEEQYESPYHDTCNTIVASALPEVDLRSRLRRNKPSPANLPDLRTQLSRSFSPKRKDVMDRRLATTPLRDEASDQPLDLDDDCNSSTTTPLKHIIRKASKIMVQWVDDFRLALPKKRKAPSTPKVTSSRRRVTLSPSDKPSPIPVLVHRKPNLPNQLSPSSHLDVSSKTAIASSKKPQTMTTTTTSRASPLKKDAGRPSSIPAKMTRKSLSSLPAWAQLGISDYLGETEAVDPLMVNTDGVPDNAKFIPTKEHSEGHVQIHDTTESAVTNTAAAVILRHSSRKLITALEKVVAPPSSEPGSSGVGVSTTVKDVEGEMDLNNNVAPLEGQKTAGAVETDQRAPEIAATNDDNEIASSSVEKPEPAADSFTGQSPSPMPDTTSDNNLDTPSLTSLVPQIESFDKDSGFGSILSESTSLSPDSTTPSSDLESDPRKQRLLQSDTASSLKRPLEEVLEGDETTGEPPNKKLEPESPDSQVERQQHDSDDKIKAVGDEVLEPVTKRQKSEDHGDEKIEMGHEMVEPVEPLDANITAQSLTERVRDNQDLDRSVVDNKWVESVKSEPEILPTIKSPTQGLTDKHDQKESVVGDKIVEPLKPLHVTRPLVKGRQAEKKIVKQEDSQAGIVGNVINPVAGSSTTPSPTMLPPSTTPNNDAVAGNKVSKPPLHKTNRMPPPLMKRPCKKARKPVPFDCTASPLPQGPVTKLQLDLDQILLSIRRVFLVNHLTHSLLSLEVERDTCVAEMKDTTRAYSHFNLVQKEGRQNFSCWQVRWGYMFMYLMRHAHLVFLSLKHLHLIQRPITTLNHIWNIPFDCGGAYLAAFLRKCSVPGGVLRVVAIGGGPGSDLIGLALFLRANNFHVRIRAVVFDKCGHWSKSWNDLHRELPPMLARYFEPVQYIPFDYLIPELSPVQRAFVSAADLITIVKSMSPVANKLLNTRPVRLPRRGPVKPHSLYNILSLVASGTLVLYIDNKNGQQSRVMQEAVQSVPGYTMVHYETSTEKLPRNGFSPLCQKFMQWVGYGPSFNSGNNEIVAMSRRWRFEY